MNTNLKAFDLKVTPEGILTITVDGIPNMHFDGKITTIKFNINNITNVIDGETQKIIDPSITKDYNSNIEDTSIIVESDELEDTQYSPTEKKSNKCKTIEFYTQKYPNIISVINDLVHGEIKYKKASELIGCPYGSVSSLKKVVEKAGLIEERHYDAPMEPKKPDHIVVVDTTDYSVKTIKAADADDIIEPEKVDTATVSRQLVKDISFEEYKMLYDSDEAEILKDIAPANSLQGDFRFYKPNQLVSILYVRKEYLADFISKHASASIVNYNDKLYITKTGTDITPDQWKKSSKVWRTYCDKRSEVDLTGTV